MRTLILKTKNLANGDLENKELMENDLENKGFSLKMGPFPAIAAFGKMKPHLENKGLSEIDLENKELGTAKRRARPDQTAPSSASTISSE